LCGERTTEEVKKIEERDERVQGNEKSEGEDNNSKRSQGIC
jgi:hypothetical protein